MPKPKRRATRKTARMPARWTPARLMKLAPESPLPASQDEVLARIRSMLSVPDTPERPARRS